MPKICKANVYFAPITLPGVGIVVIKSYFIEDHYRLDIYSHQNNIVAFRLVRYDDSRAYGLKTFINETVFTSLFNNSHDVRLLCESEYEFFAILDDAVGSCILLHKGEL